MFGYANVYGRKKRLHDHRGNVIQKKGNFIVDFLVWARKSDVCVGNAECDSSVASGTLTDLTGLTDLRTYPHTAAASGTAGTTVKAALLRSRAYLTSDVRVREAVRNEEDGKLHIIGVLGQGVGLRLKID